MEINYNIISLIEILGLIQGLIIGFLLLIVNRKKINTTLFLGLFILVYALNSTPTLLEDLNITTLYPQLNFLPLDFYWLMFPLFYIYVQNISILSSKRISYWVLIPGLLRLLLSSIIYFQDPATQLQIDDSLWFALLDLGGIVFSIFIGVKAVRWINKHSEEVKNQYTYTEFRELKWAKYYMIFALVFVISSFFTIFFEENFYTNLTYAIIDVLMLYWVSIRGLLQHNIKNLIPENNPTENKKTIPNNLKSTLISKENTEKLLQKIEHYIISEKAFTKVDLSITDISEKVGKHPKYISNLINSSLNQNFNTYINGFRIEAAKELLKNDSAHNLSIEGIGNEAGFKSKSTFYDAFKKHTGTTPSLYKNTI